MKKLQENCMDTIEIAILEGETYYSASHKFLVLEILNKVLTSPLYSAFDRINGFVSYLEAEEDILQIENKIDMKKIVNKSKNDSIDYINSITNHAISDVYSFFHLKNNNSLLDKKLLDVEEKIILSISADMQAWKDKLDDYYKATKIHDLQAQKEFIDVCEKIKVA